MFTGSVGPNPDTVIALDDMLMTSEDCTPVLSVQCDFDGTTCLWTNEPQGLQWFSSDSFTDHALNGPADSETQGMEEVCCCSVWGDMCGVFASLAFTLLLSALVLCLCVRMTTPLIKEVRY